MYNITSQIYRNFYDEEGADLMDNIGKVKEKIVNKERRLVEKLFRKCEKSGFAETFWTPYTDHKDRIGQKFEVVRRVKEGEADLECLPLWIIRFEDGKEITAYPEEIIKKAVNSVKRQLEIGYENMVLDCIDKGKYFI
jgi:hypothetical protein